MPNSSPDPFLPVCIQNYATDYAETPQADLSSGSARKAASAKLHPAPHAYAIPRYRVMLVRESLGHPSPLTIRDSESADRLLVPLFEGLDREPFMVVGLDAKHAVIGINPVNIGSGTLRIVHPREVFTPVILMNASAVILGQNHPSSLNSITLDHTQTQ
ncbi:MAG: JAB domain-containing protein [Nitrospira sp.]|nr:JAB domain-containing protein [Nitrospira sp.]